MTLSELFTIDNNLRVFLNETEKYFSIKIDREIIEKIFRDAEVDQVNEKEYIIFQSQGTIFKKGLTITGSVDGYEPETILVEITKIDKKDLKHFKALASDINLFGKIL